MSTYQILLGGPVPKWGEMGGYAHQRIADVRERLRLTNAWIDPLTGYLSAEPRYVVSDENTANWPTRTGSGTWATRKVESEQRTLALYYPGTDAWTATHLPSAQGQGFSLYFALAPLAGGANDTLTLTFGGIWKLILTENAEAELQRLVSGSYETQTFFESPLLSLFQNNRLLIYEAGDRLLFKDWALLEGGFVFIDEAPELDAADRPHALRGAAPVVAATGRVHLALRTETWRTSWTAQLDPPQSLWTPSTLTETHEVFSWKPDEVTLTPTVYDQDGNVWATGTPAKTGYYWSLAGSSTDSRKTAFVGRVHVNIDRSLASSGTVAVDLSTVADIVEVELTESLDPAACQLRVLVKDDGDLSSYLQPAQRVDFLLDAVTLHTGLLLSPRRTVIGGSLEVLELISSAARRLEIGTIFNLDAQDGELLETALSNAIQSAAIAPGSITVPTLGYPIPVADPENEPTALPHPGDSPKAFLEWLLDSFAADYYWHPLPVFAYEVLLRNAGGAVQATFYQSTAAAVAAGQPNRKLLRGLQQIYDDSGYANLVIVVGQAKNGDPLIAVELNWTDINTVPPYLPIVLLILDENLQTEAVCNWVCRQAANRVSVKRTRLVAELPFSLAIPPGKLVAISGYASNYRVLNWRARWPPRNPGKITYELEAV